jgi:hypothetical protein
MTARARLIARTVAGAKADAAPAGEADMEQAR